MSEKKRFVISVKEEYYFDFEIFAKDEDEALALGEEAYFKSVTPRNPGELSERTMFITEPDFEEIGEF